METLRFAALLVTLNFVLTSNLTPKITRHPQHWFLDNGKFESGQPFWTTASIHNPSGVAKFTCEATGASPITYRWYAFYSGIADQHLPLITGNSSLYWISGPTLIIRKNTFSVRFIVCEAVNPFGSQMSEVAKFYSQPTKPPEIKFLKCPIALIGCYLGNEITEQLPGGKVTIYNGTGEYRYHITYSVDREVYMNITDDKRNIYFSFPPFVAVDLFRIPKSNIHIFSCIQEYNATFIVNSTLNKNIWPPPPSIYPSRYFGTTLRYAVTPAPAKLRLLYIPPYDGLQRRPYQVGDDLQLACFVAAPPSVDEAKIMWIAPDNREIPRSSKDSRISIIKDVWFAVVLRIKNLQLSDTGRYLCKLEIYSSKFSQMNVTAYIRPIQPVQFLTKEAVDKVVDEGQKMSLSCSFNASNRPRRFVLLRNGQSIFDRVLSKTTLIYRISALDAEKHEGVYQCLVEDEGDLKGIFTDVSSRPPSLKPRERLNTTIFGSRYASVTVARLIIKSVNRYDPVILSAFGNRLGFDYIIDENKLTTIIVADKDAGRNGRIDGCSAACIPSMEMCPDFRLISRGFIRKASNIFRIGYIGFPMFPQEYSMNISCWDSGNPKRYSSLTLEIFPCNSNATCEKSKLSNTGITKELGELAITDTESFDKFSAELQGYLQRLLSVSGANPDLFSTVDQYLAVQSVESVLDTIRERPSTLPTVMGELTSVVGNILRVSPAVMNEGQRQVGIASRLLKVLDRITREINATNPNERVWYTTNLVLGAIDPRPSISLYVRLDVALKSSKVESAKISRASNVSANQIGASIAIQTEAVAGGRVDFSLFTNVTLFQALSTNASNQRLLSPIIAARAALTKDLKDPVFLTFNYDPMSETAKYRMKVECAFWNFSSNQWDTSGCQVYRSSARQTLCKCSHLTNFALLMTVERGSLGKNQCPSCNGFESVANHHSDVLFGTDNDFDCLVQRSHRKSRQN